jgi:hypothetical protein
MGAAADQKTNKVIFPIEGMDAILGLEERLIQSSLTGIYPGVLPDVKIIDVPEKPGKIVAVVKVHESAEAPHAIQNSTRVYIRTGSLSNPYDLAEIDRIEYLLKRREQPQRLRDELTTKTDARFREHVREELRRMPYVVVEVARLFPREQIIAPESVHEFTAPSYAADPVLQHFIERAKRIPNGVFSTWHPNGLPYAELSAYGLVQSRSLLQLVKSSWQPNKGVLFVRPAGVVWAIGRTLRLADRFFQWARFSGNVRVTAQFVNVLHQCLQYSGHETDDLEYACSDQEFSADEYTTTEALRDDLMGVTTALCREAFWAFNCDYEALPEKVQKCLKDERLV